MCDDDWVKLAMADDTKVVDLLLRLHRPQLYLHWTVRQRRSRSVPSNHNHNHNKPDPTTTSTRASPTTPLSWSGATSPSGGAIDGGYDDSRHAQTSRSKVANPSETTTTKKSRRKKTLAELKEEENLLLKERRSLKNELASLHLTVEKHRATNESLKRIKLDLESRQNSKTATRTFEVSGKAVLDPPQFLEAQCNPSNSVSPKTVTLKVNLDDDSPVCAANASSKPQEIGNQESTFVLPDLNLPVEQDLMSSNAMH